MKALILALALLLSGASAYADRGSALAVFGTILQAFGAVTGQAYLVGWGAGLIAAGPAGIGAARARERRRKATAQSKTKTTDSSSGVEK